MESACEAGTEINTSNKKNKTEKQKNKKSSERKI
jgi:hypothetical protein